MNNEDIENLTDEQLIKEFYICKREMECRNFNIEHMSLAIKEQHEIELNKLKMESERK